MLCCNPAFDLGRDGCREGLPDGDCETGQDWRMVPADTVPRANSLALSGFAAGSVEESRVWHGAVRLCREQYACNRKTTKSEILILFVVA